MKKYKDRSWLKQKYKRERRGSKEVGKLCGVCEKTILNWLDKYNIEKHGQGELRQNHIFVSKKLKENIEGLILGDASLVGNNKNGATRYSHGDNNREYLKKLKEKLKELGLVFSNNGLRDLGMERECYQLRSRHIVELNELQKNWYGTGEKKIPRNFTLTPIKLFHWFVGDGCLDSRSRLIIRNSQFTGSHDNIVKQLKNRGIKAAASCGQIRIRRESHQNFYDYIINPAWGIPPGYEYKFPESVGGTHEY